MYDDSKEWARSMYGDSKDCVFCKFYHEYLELRLTDNLFDKGLITAEEWKEIRRGMGLVEEAEE